MPIKVNLLISEDFEKKPLGKFLKWILSYGRYIIICVELIVLLVFFSRFVFDRKIADLNETIEQKKAIVASAQDLETQIRNFQNDLKRVNDLDVNRDTYLLTIEKIKSLTPKDTLYSEVSFDAETVSLEGTTPSSTSFAYFLSLLQKEETLIKIDLSKVTKDNDSGLIEFTLSAVIKSIHDQQEQAKQAAQLNQQVQEKNDL